MRGSTDCDIPDSGRIDALSSDGPWIFTASGRTVAPASVKDWYAYINTSFPAQNFTRTECNAVVGSNISDTSSDLAKWCECRAKSDVFQDIDSTRYAYANTGSIFGFWALISIWICVYFVKERSQMQKPGEHTALKRPAPMVPSILNTMNNKPFTLLLPAFVLDALSTSIISSLLTFFVRYIVEPEHADGCSPVGSNKWYRKSTNVLGHL